LIGFMILMALCGGLSAFQYVPNMAYLGEIAGPAQRATAMGAFNVAGTIGMIAGFISAGVLSDRSYSLAYSAGGILELLCACAGGGMLLIRWRLRGRIVQSARENVPAQLKSADTAAA